MKKLYLSIIFISLGILTQAQNFEWVIRTGTINPDSPTDHYTDKYGYTYLCYTGNGGFAIKKIDPAGSTLWSASSGSGTPKGITADAQGNVFVAGYYSGSATIGGNTLTDPSGNTDGFIAKIDESGSWLWAQKCGSTTGNDLINAIDIDQNTGDIITTGGFKGTSYFDTVSVVSSSGQDMFVARYTNNGSCLWVNSAGNFGDQYGVSLTVDQFGNTYVTGKYIDNIQFGPDLLVFSGPGGQDAFITKVSPSGSFIWGTSVHGTNNNIWSNNIILDSLANNCFVYGRYTGATSFPDGTNYPDPGSIYPYIIKVDSAGNGVWTHGFGYGSASGAIPYPGELVYKRDSIYYSGTIYNQGASDIGGFAVQSNGLYDVFVAAMDDQTQTTGRVYHMTDAAGSSEQGGYLSADPAGALILSASFNANTTIGSFNLNTLGSSDVFVAKEGCNFSPTITSNSTFFCSGDSLNIQASPLNGANYQWFLNGTEISGNTNSIYLNQPGKIQVIVTKNGCSSISPYINISQNQSYFIPNSTSICYGDSALIMGAYQHTSGVFTDSLTTVNGCDSIIETTLTVFAPSGSTDVISSCTPYTWIDGVIYSSSNNSATYTFSNMNGCDSIVTLNLTIQSVNTSVTQNGITLTANESGASYEWLDCSTMTPITGANSRSYTATSNGNYAVVVTNSNCSDTSTCYTVTGVGVSDNRVKEISLYPNPTHGNFTIDLGNQVSTAKVEVIDLIGQIIFSQTFTNSKILNLSIDAPNGIYLVSISAGEFKKIVKVIKD